MNTTLIIWWHYVNIYICYCRTLLLSLPYADYTKSCLCRNSTPTDIRFSKKNLYIRWRPPALVALVGTCCSVPAVFGLRPVDSPAPPFHRSTTTATHPHSTSGSWQLCQVVGFNTSLLAALKHLALGNLENLFRCSTSRNSLSMTHPIPSNPDPSILVLQQGTPEAHFVLDV